jgi:hypothetical protein
MFYVQAAASIFLWYKLFYFLRMFESVSYIIRALLEIIYGIGAFIAIFVISTFAFSQGNYVASKYHELYGIGAEQGEVIYYPGYFDSWISSWEVMTGNTTDLALSGSLIAFVIHIASLLFMLLASLNMLIARVDDLYGEVRDTQHEHALRERAELICNVRSFPLSNMLSKRQVPGKLLFVAKTQAKLNKQSVKIKKHGDN